MLELSSGVDVAWFCLFIFSKYSCFSWDNKSPLLKNFFLSSYRMQINTIYLVQRLRDEVKLPTYHQLFLLEQLTLFRDFCFQNIHVSNRPGQKSRISKTNTELKRTSNTIVFVHKICVEFFDSSVRDSCLGLDTPEVGCCRMFLSTIGQYAL